MLDMGTSGGELFSKLGRFPQTVFETESYPPNVPIVKERLISLGINVFQIFDDEQPFQDEQFD